MSVGTAFYPRQRELNRHEVWGEWAGYFAAQVYADFHDIEYSAIREAAAAIDTSPLYKYVVAGPDAARLLDRIFTRNISTLQIDQVFYTPWCDEDGKVLDDGTVTRLAGDEYRVTSADPCYRWFLMNATTLDVDVSDVSEDLAALALQGRFSREVLEAATNLCAEVSRRYARATIVTGQLVFRKEGFFQRLLHNETPKMIQQRLQWLGIPMVVLPVRVHV